MMRHRLQCLLLLLSLPAATAALGAATIFGASAAQSCYEHATHATASYRQAMSTCTRAIENEALNQRDLAATYSNRGMIESRHGRHERAIADYDRALSILPTLIHAIINRGNTLTRMERFEEALHDYDMAIFYSEGRNALVFYNRSMVHLQMDRQEQARRDLLRALELRPESLRYREALAGLK